MLSQGRNYMGNDVLLGKVEGNCMAGSSNLQSSGRKCVEGVGLGKMVGRKCIGQDEEKLHRGCSIGLR